MRGLLLVLSVVLLAGCYTSGKRGTERGLVIHDLGLSVERLAGVQRSGILAIEVRAPLWMDSLGINYRLTYADASVLREYSRSRWAGPPGQLIEQRLLQQLDGVPSGLVRGKCLLRLEIAEFSQVFSAPEESTGVLRGRALWLDAGRRIVAERPLAIAMPATTADARGGVAALQASVGQLAVQLLSWEQQLQASKQIRDCAD